MNLDDALSSPEIRWQLPGDERVQVCSWDEETALYFEGADETMVVSRLGATAIKGVFAGCSDLAALEGWCREHGFAGDEEGLADALTALLDTLAELEIIELLP